jgi:hypothetical protein
MSIQRTILYSSLVKPYYRRNAGLFCFFFFMMTLAVGRANGVGLLEYHYALIKGMMINPSFLIAVLAAWFIYALKCAQFIAVTLRNPAFSYLYMLSLANTRKVYWQLLLVQLILFLPVLSYLVIILGVGYHEHWYVQSGVALLFTLAVCALSAWWYLYLLRNPGIIPFGIAWKLPSLFTRRNYVSFLNRFVLENCKVLFLVIKMYNCATLYLMTYDRNPARHQDIRMEVLFFSAGMLGHGILIYRLKEMENTSLAFYRGLPLSLNRRFAQYVWFYLCLFIPEMVTIVSRAPAFLNYSEAGFFICFGYGILLLLNSLQLYNYSRLKDYLVTISQLFFAVIIAMIVRQLYVLPVIFLLLSVILFYRRYYRFDPGQMNAV